MNLRFVRSSFLACASVAVLTLAGCTDDEKPLAQPSCTDGIQNGVETDVDCGGADCDACALDKACAAGTDCESGVCGADHTCVDETPTGPSCDDGIKNGEETDVDCGGADCDACALDKACAAGTDCASGLCGAGNTCVECVEASTCPAPDASMDPECAAAACSAEGRCEIAFADAGTALESQTAGDCVQLECDGAGLVTEANLDTDVPVDDNPCAEGVCTDGVASTSYIALGTGCGTGMACDGEGTCRQQCADVSTCPALEASMDPECATPVCNTDGLCEVAFTDAGVAVTTQVSGDCLQAECDGAGVVVENPLATDLPVDDDPCTLDVCTDGVSSNPFAQFGTTCGTDTICDGADSCVSVAGEIQAVLDTPDGGGLSLPITAALVTYVRSETIGTDYAGFFIQADPTGPALFVQTDLASLSQVPEVGDAVAFTVTDLLTTGGIKAAIGITDFAVLSSGNDVAPFIQDVNGVTSVTDLLAGYTTELISVEGTLGATSSNAGSGFIKFALTTASIRASPFPSFRLTPAMAAALDIVGTCTVAVNGLPLWRYNTDAQVTLWKESDLASLTGCPAPKLLAATALDSTTVLLAFDRHIDPASILADGSQFTFDSGLVASAAVADGKAVTITTSAMTEGTTYTVTVADTVTDTTGAPLAAGARSVAFGAYVCRDGVVISQVYGGGGNSGAPYTNDFIELHNRSAVDVVVDGWSVQYASAAGTSWNPTLISGTIPAGGFYLVQEGGGSNGSPLPTADVTGSIAMSYSSAKVALVNSTAALSGSCPTADPSLIDFVGFGTANCAEGFAAPAPSNTTSISRLETTDDNQLLACIDINVNGLDFVTGAPTPRNTASPGRTCACP